MKIKIYTRSFNPELYKLSSTLYNHELEAVRLTDRMADGYFFSMLADTECDVAVNIDEDAFVTDWDAVMRLIETVVEGEYANAGTPDCGPGCPRGCNPIVTNPFFNVLNLKLIRTKYSREAVRKFDYKAVKQEMKEDFDGKLLERLDGNLECHDFEPYYQFFLWMAYNFKTLYLPATRHSDGISTILSDNNGNPFCLHSWFARKFGVDKDQTARINALIDAAYTLRGVPRPHLSAAERVFNTLELAVRYLRKAFMRISNWPHKWGIWWRRWRNGEKIWQ
ncbi:MAG: carboxymuconolactone decarboxylase family protein [Bacteroidales bacterium]|nr:carboxymuconolactone decarboxylase family protein [Bacteroidales bacterium]